MNRSNARPIALAPHRGASAATGAFALPLLAFLFATCESAFVTVAERVFSAAGVAALLP